jgi:hypothetical protein
MNGDEDTGIRGGLGGRAGRTVEGLDWMEELIRFSISSMSDWEDAWRGIVSLLCDIFFFGYFPEKCVVSFVFAGK